MTTPSFDDDRRFCTVCDAYVRYLSSPHRSWCVRCGEPVRLFSRPDMARFRSSLRRTPWAPAVDDERSALEPDLPGPGRFRA